MNGKQLAIGLSAAGLLAAIGYGFYAVGMQRGMAMSGARGETPSTSPAAGSDSTQGEEATRRHIASGLKAGDVDPVTGKKILYYRDPMVPGNKFDKPAKSPFMDMLLVPVYAGGEADESSVTVSPRIQQTLGVRTAAVTEGTLSPQFSAVGSIAYNERDQAVVQARATGYVERLHVRATLDRVAKGQPLLDLYIPDWIATQEEFLAVRRMKGSDLADLVDGARQRMRQVGMSDSQIQAVEESGSTQPRITLAAPIGGVISELMVREGMTVMAGGTLMRINGLATVWANAEVPESQSALLRPGAHVQAKSPAAPGITFEGKVQAILPEVNQVTRTVKARLELANPGGRLAPGMFVQMQFMDMRPEKTLLVPTEAVIQTGRRTVVLLAEDNGGFRPLEIDAGIEVGGQTEVKRGLQPGQRVVVSSQFLIDSEASLKGVEARLNDAPPAAAANKGPRHQGEARIEAVGRDALTLSHGPIPSMKWAPMTMEFKLPPNGLPRGIAVGDRVRFEFFIGADELPQLTSVAPLAPDLKSAGSKP